MEKNKKTKELTCFYYEDGKKVGENGIGIFINYKKEEKEALKKYFENFSGFTVYFCYGYNFFRNYKILTKPKKELFDSEIKITKTEKLNGEDVDFLIIIRFE